MADTTIEGYCPICKQPIIHDEEFVACDRFGRSTGDAGDDIFDGTPQTHVGHPGCVTAVDSAPDTPLPRVWSRRVGATPPPPGAVVVDRSSDFGNPFPVGRLYRRGESVRRHREWFFEPEQAPLRERVRAELRGKDLVCWCVSGAGVPPPLVCHAQTLLEYANKVNDDDQ